MSENDTIDQKSVKHIIEKYNKLAPAQDKLDIRDDREKLLARLRLSREELDTYIRHSKKVLDDKKYLERENQELKSTIDNLKAKISRLEKFDSTLRVEFSQLCRLMQSQNMHKLDPEASLVHLKEFLEKFLDDPTFMSQTNDFFDEFDKIKQEIVKKQNTITDLENKIEEMTKNRTTRSQGSNELFDHQMFDDIADLSEAVSTVTSNDEKIYEDVKNQLVSSYMEQLSYIKALFQTLEQKRLCKIDKKTHLPDIDQFFKIIDAVSANETCLPSVSSEFNKKLKIYVDIFIEQIEYLDKKAFDFFQTNESLTEEVNNLKYALSHRLEMQEMRQAAKVEACNCSAQLMETKEEMQRIKKELKIKETELEIAEENKFSLIQLLATITNTDGEAYEDTETTTLDPIENES